MTIIYDHHVFSSCVIIIYYHNILSSYVIILCYHHVYSSCIIIISYHHILSSYIIITYYHHPLLPHTTTIYCYHILSSHMITKLNLVWALVLGSFISVIMDTKDHKHIINTTFMLINTVHKHSEQGVYDELRLCLYQIAL